METGIGLMMGEREKEQRIIAEFDCNKPIQELYNALAQSYCGFQCGMIELSKAVNDEIRVALRT